MTWRPFKSLHVVLSGKISDLERIMFHLQTYILLNHLSVYRSSSSRSKKTIYRIYDIFIFQELSSFGEYIYFTMYMKILVCFIYTCYLILYLKNEVLSNKRRSNDLLISIETSCSQVHESVESAGVAFFGGANVGN